MESTCTQTDTDTVRNTVLMQVTRREGHSAEGKLDDDHAFLTRQSQNHFQWWCTVDDGQLLKKFFLQSIIMTNLLYVKRYDHT